jgi:hypothetical protein
MHSLADNELWGMVRFFNLISILNCSVDFSVVDDLEEAPRVNLFIGDSEGTNTISLGWLKNSTTIISMIKVQLNNSLIMIITQIARYTALMRRQKQHTIYTTRTKMRLMSFYIY